MSTREEKVNITIDRIKKLAKYDRRIRIEEYHKFQDYCYNIISLKLQIKVLGGDISIVDMSKKLYTEYYIDDENWQGKSKFTKKHDKIVKYLNKLEDTIHIIRQVIEEEL